MRETAADPALIELQCCLEKNKPLQIPEDYKQVAKRPTHRWGITMVDDRIIIAKSLLYAVLNAVQFGHPGIKKMCSDATIFWWPNLWADIEKKANTCSACLNAGKNLKPQISYTEKLKIQPPKKSRRRISNRFY